MGRGKIYGSGGGLNIKNGITAKYFCADNEIKRGTFVSAASITSGSTTFESDDWSTNNTPNWVFVPKITSPKNRALIIHPKPYTMTFAYFDISSNNPVLLCNVVHSTYYSLFYYCAAHQLSDGRVLALGGSGSASPRATGWVLATLTEDSLTTEKVDGMINRLSYTRGSYNFLDRGEKTWIVMSGVGNATDVLALWIGLPFETTARAAYSTTTTAYGPLACWLNEQEGKMLVMYSDNYNRHIITAQVHDDDSVNFNSDDTVIGTITNLSGASIAAPAVDIAEGVTPNTFVYVTPKGESKVILAKYENGTYEELDSIDLTSYNYDPIISNSVMRGRHLRKEGNFYVLASNMGNSTLNVYVRFNIDEKNNKFINVTRFMPGTAAAYRTGFSLVPVGKLLTSSGYTTMTCYVQGYDASVTDALNNSNAIVGITSRKSKYGELADVIVPAR